MRYLYGGDGLQSTEYLSLNIFAKCSQKNSKLAGAQTMLFF